MKECNLWNEIPSCLYGGFWFAVLIWGLQRNTHTPCCKGGKRSRDLFSPSQMEKALKNNSNWFPFHFTAVFLSHAEAFYFDESHLFILSFMSLALGQKSVRILLRGMSKIFLPMFFL